MASNTNQWRKRLRLPRQLVRALLVGGGYLYDLYRFARFGGWRDDLDAVRRYRVAKTSHSLEKSMAFRTRREGAGWDAAYKTATLLPVRLPLEGTWFADANGYDTLQRFLDLKENRDTHHARALAERLGVFRIPQDARGGVVRRSRVELLRGQLDSPEDFFFSRHTVRHFAQESIDQTTVRRAVRLAMKSPAACNRQPWHVYHLRDRHLIDAALSYQTGNRGFGHEIPELLIVCSDLRAFVSGNERYQHWIDGGMFAMSLVLALHSLGIASCCLNWSKMVRDDLRLRRRIRIRDEHTVIMMLGIGYPLDENVLCRSTRRPMEEVYTMVAASDR